MSHITIKIETGNAAFEDNPGELTEILEGLAADAANGELDDGDTIRDSNGNAVGSVSIED